MTHDITIRQEEKFELLSDIDHMQQAARKLLQTKHYQAMGEAGIFAIIQKAKAVKLDPLEALNGGLYFVNGKVGMAAETMNRLIRSKGHSITKDPKSNDTICIIHGKRADTGDTWTESFSIDDAKRAGIYKDTTPWGKFPRNMCFNRALSNLARQLFPDVIGGCYEIDELRSFADPEYTKLPDIKEVEPELTEEEIQTFYSNFNGDKGMTEAYVKFCADKKKWTLSKTIINLQQDLEASHKAYKAWEKKQKPVEVKVEAVSTPMEAVSVFEEVK